MLNWLILIKAWIGQDLDLALALAISGIQYPKNVKVCQRLVREVKMYKQQGDTGYWVGKRGCASANDLFGLVICPQQLATAWGHRSSGTSLERRAPKPPLTLSPLASSYRGPCQCHQSGRKKRKASSSMRDTTKANCGSKSGGICQYNSVNKMKTVMRTESVRWLYLRSCNISRG